MSRSLILPLGALVTALMTAPPALADPAGPAWTHEPIGSTAIFRLASAPFPHPSRVYRDDRVMLFVPAGFRPGPKVDLIVHYHGHNNEIVKSDRNHRYREQLFLSCKNAVLVQPQGPLSAADSGGGKHEEAGGLRRFVDEVLVVLRSEGAIPASASLGKVLLSGHSGGYHVIAKELTRGGVEVSEVHLHDALYGEVGTYEAWARAPGHRLVSTSTVNGGTFARNEDLRARLQAAGIAVGATEDDVTLASSRALVLRTDVAHGPVTHQRLRWAEILKTSALADLGAPRPRLRSVRADGAGTVEVAWYPVRSALLRGYRLYYASDPAGPFSLVLDEHTLGASSKSARLVQGSTDVSYRLTTVDDRGVESSPSNVYAGRPDGDPRRRILVVDGFVRTSAGWTRHDHAFSALAGRSIGAAGRAFDTCRASAVTDGSVRLADYASVVWLAGDQSSEDAALTREEQRALAAYLVRGGALLLSGSEVGYDLCTGEATAEDRAFFTGTLHATYVADSNPGRALSGSGALPGLSLPFGGASAPYRVRTPDVLAPGPGAAVALRFADGRGAAVSFEGKVGAGAATSGVLTLGFPLECADTGPARDGLVLEAIEWLEGVNLRAGR